MNKFTLKSFLIVLAQYSLGVAIIYSLIRFGYKIDFQSIKGIVYSPFFLYLIFLKIVGFTFAAYRWSILLKAFQSNHALKDVYQCSLIGFALSYIIPGAISGDVAKVYLLKANSTSKRVIFSILLDRISGLLVVLLFIAFSLIYAQLYRPEFFTAFFMALDVGRQTALMVAAALLAVGLAILFVLYKKRHFLAQIAEAKHLTLGTIAKCLGLSLLAHISFIFFLYHTSLQMGYVNVDPIGLALCYSLAALIIVIPITPGGLGVGQTVYALLFTWYFSNSFEELGASLFTVSQVADFVLVIGGIAWLGIYYSRKVPLP